VTPIGSEIAQRSIKWGNLRTCPSRNFKRKKVIWVDLVTNGKILKKNLKKQRELSTGSELTQRIVKWGNL